MKKKNVINLIRYHIDGNENGFRNEATEIANDFSRNDDTDLAKYIMSMLSNANAICPQMDERDFSYLEKVELKYSSLPLPKCIADDISGVINAINKNAGINKFLFYGKPGTGKTESVKQIARILDRELYIAKFENIIDSKLGQTSKNIDMLFDDINSFQRPDKVIVLFDELDAIVLDRINNNDLREMGRATSTFLKCLERMKESITIIATTNLFDSLDKAIIRRFDYAINFDRYSREDLIEVGKSVFDSYNKKSYFKSDVRLFEKILQTSNRIPFPGELKNIIKSSIAFSNENDDTDYLKRLYKALNNVSKIEVDALSNNGYTLRQIQTLTGVSKSKVGRDIKEFKNE